MRVLGDGEGREHREVGHSSIVKQIRPLVASDAWCLLTVNDAGPSTEEEGQANRVRERRVGVERREYTHSYHEDRPSKPMLGTIYPKDGHGYT